MTIQNHFQNFLKNCVTGFYDDIRFGDLEDTDSRLASFEIVASYCFSNLILKSDSSSQMNLDSFAKIRNKYLLCI